MKEILGAKPFFFQQEKYISNEIKRILISGNLSQGKNIKNFEKKLPKYLILNFQLQ